MDRDTETQAISRNNRLTVLLSDEEESDVRLVASFHGLELSTLLREWAMRDVRAEARTIRTAVVELKAAESGKAKAA